MPSGISAAMLAELQNSQSRVVPTLELTIDGTTHRMASAPLSSATYGPYLSRVISWGDFSRPGMDGSYALRPASGSCSIDDSDETLAKIFGGAARGSIIETATATAHLRSDAVAVADHFKFLDGIVVDYGNVDRQMDFTFGPSSLALDAEQNNIRKIAERDWPDAPKASFGRDGQVVYGRHRSTGLSGSAGMVPTVPVSKLQTAAAANNWWYISTGKLISGALKNAYRNGTLATADFALEYKLRNGVWNTIVRDTAGTSDPESDTITLDVDGVESNGNGLSGALITAPVDILEHFLSNFVFNSYPTGSVDGTRWLVRSQAPINTTSTDSVAAFLFDRNYNAARVLSTSDRGISVINEWGSDHKVTPFWAWDWKFGLALFRHGTLDINTTRVIKMEDVRGDGKRRMSLRKSNLVNEIEANYLRDTAGGSLRLGPVRITDARRTPTITRSLDRNWDEASLV